MSNYNSGQWGGKKYPYIGGQWESAPLHSLYVVKGFYTLVASGVLCTLVITGKLPLILVVTD